jgi:hypothetical protein
MDNNIPVEQHLEALHKRVAAIEDILSHVASLFETSIPAMKAAYESIAQDMAALK